MIGPSTCELLHDRCHRSRMWWKCRFVNQGFPQIYRQRIMAWTEYSHPMLKICTNVALTSRSGETSHGGRTWFKVEDHEISLTTYPFALIMRGVERSPEERTAAHSNRTGDRWPPGSEGWQENTIQFIHVRWTIQIKISTTLTTRRLTGKHN